ncbi:chemotaxis protein CheA [Leptospira selangorensis]|uniref:Chemotaxis protein CheA n=1 Tax=Leptospira selangorensis TaxID=2484982 RepID=A0A4V3JC28_9LEPT|nr:chemotaxis protein CheA [Leptospira selangorensis]TGK04459.1 chemotaxis protein CheA [Leptospira selangorensis]TGM11914.1 chemotaxis protein CheA [Leptospira selangorensis]TGM15226.1 chemotaxis protein CheA [Leptospira selangorensis]
MDREHLLSEFVSEARDLIDSAETSLLTLEEEIETVGQGNPETLNKAFRFFHTLKGSSGLLKLETVVKITHLGETLLDILRNQDKVTEFDFSDDLMETLDLLRRIFDRVEEERTDSGFEQETEVIRNKLKEQLDRISKSSEKEKTAPENKFGFFEEVAPPAPKGFGFFEEETKPAIVEKIPAPSSEVNPVIQEVQTVEKKKDIRITTDKLDQLMDFMGELVIAESNVIHHPELEGLRLEGFRSAARHLHKIVRDLQEVTLSMRMVPLSSTFQKMNRLVRDLQKRSQKKLDFKIGGEDTEVDKSVVEIIQDPIIHLLRNSIDHGLEVSEERAELGKKEKGIIRLQARQSANEVWILVADDGRGLDREKIINKAREKGILKGNPDEMSDKEVFQLIFTPGFSTAEKLTDISGRGVGMDIVLQNIKKLNGKVEVRSKKGEGTTFILRIPLTLGIIEGTVFEVGGTYLTLPTIEISELVSLKDQKLIHPYKDQEVLDLRGIYIPVIRINDLLGLREKLEYKSKNPVLIILENEDRYLGILVDEVLGNQNIVIKPLSSSIQKAQGVNGFTILGNGRVSLILDTKFLFEKFHGNTASTSTGENSNLSLEKLA